MSDVLLFQTPDDGEFNITGGVVELTDSTRTAIYLSMFNGQGWWGDPEGTYGSETAKVLDSVVLIPANLNRIKAAVERDLSWLEPAPVVTVSMPALNTVKITIDELEFVFGEKKPEVRELVDCGRPQGVTLFYFAHYLTPAKEPTDTLFYFAELIPT